MEPCERGAGGAMGVNETLCVDLTSPLDRENGIGVSKGSDNIRDLYSLDCMVFQLIFNAPDTLNKTSKKISFTTSMMS